MSRSGGTRRSNYRGGSLQTIATGSVFPIVVNNSGTRKVFGECGERLAAEFEDYQVSTPKLTGTPAATPMAAATSAGNGTPAPIAGLPGLR